MNILIDYVGHADLYYSMHALFVKRLGWKLYRPLGGHLDPEWQRLGIATGSFPDTSSPFQINEDGIYTSYQSAHNYEQTAISFEKLKDMQIDLIVCTAWENDSGLYALKKNFLPNAKIIRDIANTHEKEREIKNILLGTYTKLGADTKYVHFHPEHHTSYYYDENIMPTRTIHSYFNHFLSYKPEVERWEKFKRLLPDFEFKMFGAENPDGHIPQHKLGDHMRTAMFIWHTKPAGGCGFTARQALACGRPVIFDKTYSLRYNNLASKYFVDGVNGIDINPKVRDIYHAAKLIREWAKDINYKDKCRQTAGTFPSIINFEQEANAVRDWINGLSNDA